MTQTFPAWLRDQQKRDDEVGLFAQAFGSRDDLPEHGGRAIYDGYFASEPESAQADLDRAWMEFEAHPEPSATSDEPEGLR
ncbi:hypothetical protein C5C31_13345 [Rathayibacter rathayi]|uniref:YozE SAM-like domain-containing protein n=2 Tax=Rathayibacter rathayi TaxID=33887 RepID=A0ABD6W943_RATRA|nr:hypothetical protein [Rathayibacter rathayi]AZZ49814.1 hypothetical protein C1O28_11985 [Rathayibacter rathayi]MWV75875.1 hypothetical protein [Rathayibacter rathayi NCPPB 2980 = VKM Ac-1601]PPF14315.1 hypothetical protein C5C04_06855 [Rathayibacter rathayi]PPF42816.1 hypothetical protein C5C08_14560 [Rathayibacter rathayi]PPG64987.1 hypothetical protein C5C16_13915 [Rathayibacter rathayi]